MDTNVTLPARLELARAVRSRHQAWSDTSITAPSSHSYEGENRLKTMTRSDQTLTMTSDYVGRRIRKVVTGIGTADTKFLWTGRWLALELGGDGSTVGRTYVWRPDFSDARGSAGGAGAFIAQG